MGNRLKGWLIATGIALLLWALIIIVTIEIVVAFK